MIKWIINFLIIGLLFLGMDLSGSSDFSRYGWVIGAAVVLSLLNVVIRPVLNKLLVPITFVLLGIYTLIVNAAALAVVEWLFGSHYEFGGFFNALMISILITIVSVFVDDVVEK